MSKIEIAICEDGKLIKKVPCKSYLLAIDHSENDMTVDLLLRNDLDTIRIMGSCLAAGIEMVIKNGMVAGLTEKANQDRFNMIFDEIIQTAFTAAEAEAGKKKLNAAVQ